MIMILIHVFKVAQMNPIVAQDINGTRSMKTVPVSKQLHDIDIRRLHFLIQAETVFS